MIHKRNIIISSEIMESTSHRNLLVYDRCFQTDIYIRHHLAEISQVPDYLNNFTTFTEAFY